MNSSGAISCVRIEVKIVINNLVENIIRLMVCPRVHVHATISKKIKTTKIKMIQLNFNIVRGRRVFPG